MSKASKNDYKRLPMPHNSKFKTSLKKNSTTYCFWFNRMCNIYMNRCLWEGFDYTVDLPTLEYGLLTNGNVCFFKDKVIGQLALMGAPSGTIDVYNLPVSYYIHTASGYNNHLRVSRFDPGQNAVVIWDNAMRIAPLSTINDYAIRITEALRAADVNVNNQKTMNVILCSESQRLSLENLMKNYDGNVPHMLADKSLLRDQEGFDVHRIDTPYVADKLWTYITNIWNDFLTWAGIENATNQKRERLVSDEVNANYGNVEMERNVTLQTRQIAADNINRLFGLDIKVRFNSALDTQLNLPFQMQTEREEGGIDGSIYSNAERDGRLLRRQLDTETSELFRQDTSDSQ